ncbi:glycosyltransferase family 4 protein [Marivirga sp. S37H4]|uniref:Glycosyltransferase family 4 protein n=1 Tax=Marivirga aurantiaca TaxID=2802615 RepID=A0A935C6N1_9BACT|nr:glycosyltransferase family 4 protein [Marivirga aurantiaca]MBK6264536.1 glycosyltransferase family 4 protein [Marivirga aurantiaca]
MLKNKKKIVLAYTADVSAILITGQVKYFQDKGYEVSIITKVGEKTNALIEREGGVAYSINFEREISILKDIKSLFLSIRLLNQIKPDIVNAGTPKASLILMTASWFLRVPTRIYTCRGFRFETELGMKRFVLKTLEKICGVFAHKIVCISPSLKELAVNENIFKQEKTLVLGKGSSNGISLEKFSRAKLNDLKLHEIISDYNINKDYFTIGFAGRLHPDKGLKELFSAYDILKLKHPFIQLLLVGSLESDEIEKELEYRKQDKNLIYVGFQNAIEYFIANFNVLVLPSYREGFGNVLIQAAALGVPTITNNVTGCKDAVLDNFNGFIVPKNDVNGLVEKINLLIEDKMLQKKMGENGITFSKQFGSKTIWQELEILYQKKF